jgi:translation elongation factor EF-1alpha
VPRGASQRFDEVVHTLTPLLASLGYRSPPPTFVPLSALAGANLQTGSLPEAAREWYTGGALLDELDALTPPPRTSVVGAWLALP